MVKSRNWTIPLIWAVLPTIKAHWTSIEVTSICTLSLLTYILILTYILTLLTKNNEIDLHSDFDLYGDIDLFSDSVDPYPYFVSDLKFADLAPHFDSDLNPDTDLHFDIDSEKQGYFQIEGMLDKQGLVV